MTPDLARRLAPAFASLSSPATGVANVAGVATVARYARKPQELRPLHTKTGKGENEPGKGVAATLDAVSEATEERRVIIAECCPAPYADVFARLNHQKPHAVSVAAWGRAINDAGLFLDAWGVLAVGMQRTAGDLFDVPREDRAGGPIWRLEGERVEALGADHARLSNGRTIMRSEER